MFQETELAGKCAIVTSYRPSASAIRAEETGEGITQSRFQYNTYRKMIAEHFNEAEDSAMHKTDLFEQEVKKRFVEEPGQMKLLIVVDKLLTGFDAPPATYLYIDKKMLGPTVCFRRFAGSTASMARTKNTAILLTTRTCSAP